ncbi:hypothetical protein CRENBAI_002380 [Crenichthys baileyi]|uniref:Uncharacterized protein n=1 Tax=Crenichthys baileyi TaxID=28760 RepID=A0AAV9S8W2_9TELE
MSGTGPQPQPGKRGSKTHPTPTLRPPISHTRPKMPGPPKCKLRASIGKFTPHRQINRSPQGQPDSQADPAMHHPAHNCAQGKDAGPASQRAPQKGHSMHSKEATLPCETQNHQHLCGPSKNDRAKPSLGSHRANGTAIPYILPYIDRGTVKTTNPKHAPPTRNRPADKQTPPQYKAEKADATTEPSNTRPAAPILKGQSRRAQDHCPNITARHTAEDRMQQREPKAKAVHKAHTLQIRPHQPTKNKASCEYASPQKEEPRHPGPRTCQTPIPLPEVARPKAHPRPTQEQHGHQASYQCPPAQAPQTHRMQPPDATPKSHQSPTPVGDIAPSTRPPSEPIPGTPQMPQTQTPPPDPPHHPTG